jgi:beta-N-acetylhexosaminidase
VSGVHLGMSGRGDDDTSGRRISRRDLLRGAFLGMTAAILAACGRSEDTSSPSASRGTGPYLSLPPPGSPATGSIPPAQGTADEQALRRLIAGLLVIGFRGESLSPDSWVLRAIGEKGLGGVILFDRDGVTGKRRNINSPDQVTALIASLQAVAPQPITVSIDQEGGRVTRLNPDDGFPATASEAEIGAADDESKARNWASSMAADLARIGVTLNLAPVVDLDVNPANPAIGALDRSFSADPDVVVAMASEEIRAHHAAGVRTTLKHFPGFGSATGNTDFGVVDVTRTWRRIELTPFADLIHDDLADAVMVAHLLDRRLDPDRPASLSPAVVTDLLRGELGWQGAAVSDDMQAPAITERYGQARAVTLALRAGVDVLVFANQQVYDAGVIDDVVGSVLASVRSGRLTEARLEAAANRAQTLRTPSA